MGRKSETVAEDEIDLKEVVLALWRGRVMIVFCVLISIGLASTYLRTVPRKFTVSYTLQPVAAEASSSNLSSLSGLASFAGISLPTGGTSDFQAFQVLLRSEEVAANLMSDEALIQRIFASEWDERSKTFAALPKSPTQRIVSKVKSVLTGEQSADYLAPNAPRLAKWLSEKLVSSEDRDTGFLTLSAESEDPELIIEVMVAVTVIADQLIKERIIAEGKGSVDFYQNKILSARSREHREVLAQLIMEAEQKLMLATNGAFFVAKPLTKATISLQPTSPKNSLVLALSVVLGGLLGSAYSLVRNAFRNA